MNNGKVFIWTKDKKNECTMFDLNNEGKFNYLRRNFSYIIEGDTLTIQTQFTENTFSTVFEKIKAKYFHEKKYRLDDISFLETKVKEITDTLEITDFNDIEEEEKKNDLWLHLMKIANHKKELQKDILFECQVFVRKYSLYISRGETKCINGINFSWASNSVENAIEDVKESIIKFKIPSFIRRFKIYTYDLLCDVSNYSYKNNILIARPICYGALTGMSLSKIVTRDNICLKNLGYGILTE